MTSSVLICEEVLVGQWRKKGEGGGRRDWSGQISSDWGNNPPLLALRLSEVNLAKINRRLPFRSWELHKYRLLPETQRHLFTIKTSSYLEKTRQGYLSN